MATVSINRDSGYADRLRSYLVELDGEIIGKIADGQTKSFDVESGTHTLRLKFDWGKSNPIRFTVAASKIVHFTCASRVRGAKVIFAVIYGFFLFNRYIKLEQID
jgi:hypothetical protein